jgi:transposase
MSLRPLPLASIPEETARVTHAAFPKGNPAMRMRDALGPIFTEPQFAVRFSTEGQPAVSPAQLALVTILQFAEGLSDRRAADAVRSRIDWKYPLALPLTDAGCDASVLSEFRSRLLAGNAEALLFETLLTQLRAQGLVKPRGRQRTDSTGCPLGRMLAAIHVLNRLGCIGETLRHALDTVARVAPDWLQGWMPSDWYDRYARRSEDYRLPDRKADRYALAEQIGADGRGLLQHIYAADAPTGLREVPAVESLRRVWMQQSCAAPLATPVRWRTAEELPPAPLLISSPYDPDARYSKKRQTEWVGDKVHLTETCDADGPRLLTDVETTLATTADSTMLGRIQTHLAARHLLPGEHVGDMGYVTADHLVTSHDRGTDVLGPVLGDQSGQGRAHAGFGVACFVIDWDAQQATCPRGKTSVIGKPARDCDGHAVINIRSPTRIARSVHFARSVCVRRGHAR